MTERVEVVDGTGSLASPRALAELAEAVLSDERSRGSFSLALVGEGVMTDLNRRYRDEDGPTDVLSFPERSDGDAGTWPGDPDDDSEPSGAAVDLALGEVIICPAVVHRYAAEEGVTPEYQLGWTVIHGTLHLLGYDHERDRGEMRAREQELLSRFAGLLGELDLRDHGQADGSWT